MTTTRTGLPKALKQGIEDLSGLSMSEVRVHRNSDRPAQLEAAAFAEGQEIHAAPGQDEHLPHEAWHVVQQAKGRASATAQVKGAPAVNDDAALAREADRMGAEAVRVAGADPAGRIAADPDTGPDMSPKAGAAPSGSVLSRVGGALGGTVRVSPGVDLVAPTGEAWKAES
jgi:hypothetical protein